MAAIEVSDTERKVAEMLLENTGASILDSGGAYGRAWQNARAKYLGKPVPNSAFSGTPLDWPDDPVEDEITVAAAMMKDEDEAFITDWGVTVRAFHWLAARLEYHPDLDAKYQRWTRVTNFGKDRYDKDWGLTLTERFVEQLRKHAKVGGIYGDGEAFSDNTYNHEDALDRTLQYTYFSVSNGYNVGWDDDRRDHPEFLPDGTYVLLQIHGGCDVRGGYTDPVLFECVGDDGSWFDNARIEVWCEGADVLPKGVCDGQVSMDAEIIRPSRTSHRWDNSYDDGSTLRLVYNSGEWLDSYWPDKEEEALVLSTKDIDEEEDEQVQVGWGSQPKYAKANVARRDDQGVWRCPFDGSPLHAGGACA